MEILLIIFLVWFRIGKKSEQVHRKIPVPLYTTQEWQDLCSASPRDFELYCASWMNKVGYDCKITKAGNDSNIDFWIRDDVGTDIGIAECKHWKGKVGTSTVKVLHATMLEKGLTRGWLFALNGFSKGARLYIVNLEGMDISLISGKGLL